MGPEDRRKLQQGLKERMQTIYNKTEMQKARRKAIQPYVNASSDFSEALWKTKNWQEVVDLHRTLHPLYKDSQINQFLRLYHQ